MSRPPKPSRLDQLLANQACLFGPLLGGGVPLMVMTRAAEGSWFYVAGGLLAYCGAWVLHRRSVDQREEAWQQADVRQLTAAEQKEPTPQQNTIVWLTAEDVDYAQAAWQHLCAAQPPIAAWPPQERASKALVTAVERATTALQKAGVAIGGCYIATPRACGVPLPIGLISGLGRPVTNLDVSQYGSVMTDDDGDTWYIIALVAAPAARTQSPFPATETTSSTKQPQEQLHVASVVHATATVDEVTSVPPSSDPHNDAALLSHMLHQSLEPQTNQVAAETLAFTNDEVDARSNTMLRAVEHAIAVPMPIAADTLRDDGVPRARLVDGEVHVTFGRSTRNGRWHYVPLKHTLVTRKTGGGKTNATDLLLGQLQASGLVDVWYATPKWVAFNRKTKTNRRPLIAAIPSERLAIGDNGADQYGWLGRAVVDVRHRYRAMNKDDNYMPRPTAYLFDEQSAAYDLLEGRSVKIEGNERAVRMQTVYVALIKSLLKLARESNGSLSFTAQNAQCGALGLNQGDLSQLGAVVAHPSLDGPSKTLILPDGLIPQLHDEWEWWCISGDRVEPITMPLVTNELIRAWGLPDVQGGEVNINQATKEEQRTQSTTPHQQTDVAASPTPQIAHEQPGLRNPIDIARWPADMHNSITELLRQDRVQRLVTMVVQSGVVLPLCDGGSVGRDELQALERPVMKQLVQQLRAAGVSQTKIAQLLFASTSGRVITAIKGDEHARAVAQSE